MKKITQQEAIKSTTMFLINKEIEAEFNDLVEAHVQKYQSMTNIDTADGLKAFILSNKESILMLETILGISGERMKRIITMLRVDKGYTVDTEWTEKRFQSVLAQDSELLSEYCELFIRGYELEKYKSKIPQFILNDFRIDDTVINRINDIQVLTKLCKNRLESNYTSKYSAYYTKAIIESINKALLDFGYEMRQEYISEVGKNLYCIRKGEKTIIVSFQYSVTTSANQSKYQRSQEEIYKKIGKNDQFMLINMLDGAGWVSRHADFVKIYEDCKLFANLKNIDVIVNAVKEF